MSDSLRTFFGLAGLVRVLVVRAESIGEQVIARHDLSGFSAKLGVEGTLATLLLSAHIKGEERLLVQVQGSAPSFAFMGEVRSDGSVRARLTPNVVAPTPEISGMLLAIKHDAVREVYRGVAEVAGPGFEAALAGYLAQSQQTWGLVRLGMVPGRGRGVVLAAGVLIERLPELLPPEEFEAWMAPLREAPLEQILAEIDTNALLGHPLELLETRPLAFRCPCSLERVESTLSALGADELRSLHAEQGQAEVTCNFCNEVYVVPGPRLLGLLTALETAH